MAVDDFRWLSDDDSPLGRNFCLSFVRGAAPAEVIERLGGTQTVDIVGASQLHEAAALVQLRPDVYEDGVFHTDRVTGLVLVAASNVGEWTMIVEPNGYLCTDRAVIGVLSRGGEQVTFYFNENTSPSFTWARDGVALVEFIPDDAAERMGTLPDALDDALNELGFGDEYDELSHERTLALMERLTGVRVTPAMLKTAEFRCAGVPDTRPPGNEAFAADARQRLAEYAADPDAEVDRDVALDAVYDPWEGLDVTDPKIRATSWSGMEIYRHDPNLLHRLTRLDDDTLRRLLIEVRLWAIVEAQLPDTQWFATTHEAVRRGEPVPLEQKWAMEDRTDLTPRQKVAIHLLSDEWATTPIKTLCWAIRNAMNVDDGDPSRLFDVVKRLF